LRRDPFLCAATPIFRNARAIIAFGYGRDHLADFFCDHPCVNFATPLATSEIAVPVGTRNNFTFSPRRLIVSVCIGPYK
jgi:hypothetical protein